VEFDLDLAVRQDSENPVYYVQYAHARICTLVAAVAEDGHAVPDVSSVDAGKLDTPQEKELIKQLAALPEEISRAARDYDPSYINSYVTELAAPVPPVLHRLPHQGRGAGSAGGEAAAGRRGETGDRSFFGHHRSLRPGKNVMM
jgi:hypothetical protein